MKDKWRGIGVAITGSGIILILIIVAFLQVGPGFFGSGNAVAVNAGSGTVAFHPGFDKTPTEAQCTDNRYIDSSTRVVQTGNMEYRQFATAVTIPFKGTTDASVYKETNTEICGNPTELKMVLDDMMLWRGFPGADENKAWIVKIQDDIKSHGLDSFSGTNDAGNKIVSNQYQKYAGWVNTVLLRFNAEGKQSLASTRNWEQPATVAPGTQPVAVQASVQENKPSWVRTLRDKVGTCLYRIGFNAEDKRIETFTCAVPTPPTYTTPCTKDCGPTTPPVCKTNCSPTPPCTVKCAPPVCPPGQHGTPPVCKDSATNDPYVNGKAPTGGGKNANPGPGTYVPPDQVQQPPATPYTPPPAPPAAAPPAPTHTVDPAPAPSPEPSAPTPAEPAQGCSPPPGMTTC